MLLVTTSKALVTTSCKARVTTIVATSNALWYYRRKARFGRTSLVKLKAIRWHFFLRCLVTD